ncbi:MAG: hypothetical protein ACI841_000204 [Planctomycetota bacterium]|jgi:hypothetical protein
MMLRVSTLCSLWLIAFGAASGQEQLESVARPTESEQPSRSVQGQPPEAGDVHASIEPAKVHIGEPFVLTVRMTHDRRDAVRLPESGLLASEAAHLWMILDVPRLVTERLPDGLHASTTLRAKLLMIHPGEHQVPLAELQTQDGVPVAVPPIQLTVLGELAEGEDEARPMPGFHELPEARWQLQATHVFGVLALLALVFAWTRRSRKGPQSPKELEPIELLGQLKAGASDEPDAVRALSFEIARLLRGAVDRHLGEPQPARDDEEWLAHVEGQLSSSELFDEVRTILQQCESTKFGGELPTRFAVEERLERLEKILRRLPRKVEAA